MSVTLLVEFMDGEKRRYECLSDQSYTEVKEGVLRVMEVQYYGQSVGKPKASLPIVNIREYGWEGR